MKTRILSSVLFTLALVGCAKKQAPVERPTPVGVQAVQAFSGQDVKRFSAIIQPYEQVELSFRVGGYVQNIAQVRAIDGRQRAVQDGDHVIRGAVLAKLNSADYDARVQQARASIAETETLLAKAELDRNRATKLYESQSLTKPDFDSAKANYDATTARLASAKARLAEVATASGDTVIRAPFAGTVLKRNIALGSLAAPGMPAFALADTSSVKAVFGVPDRLIARMKLGNTLALRTEALADRELHGRITRVSAAADPKSRVFEVEVSIPNKDDQLKIGMVAALVIEDQSPDIGNAVVPISAVVASTRQPGAYAVFVAAQEKGQRVARRTEVELGNTLGNLVVVKSGLKAGDQVVTTGAGLLREGDRIEVLMSSAIPTEQR